MSFKKNTYVRFPDHNWVRDARLTPNIPYKVEGSEGGTIFIEDNGIPIAVMAQYAIKCTSKEIKMAKVLFE